MKFKVFNKEISFEHFQKVKVVVEVTLTAVESGFITDDGSFIYQLVGQLPSGQKIHFMPQDIVDENS